MILIKTYNTFSIFLILDEEQCTNQGYSLVSPVILAKNLVEHTSLQNLKYCPDKCQNTFYSYNSETGIYEVISRISLKHQLINFIRDFINLTNDDTSKKSLKLISSKWASSILSNLEIQENVFISSNQIDIDSSRYLAFKNGILDINTLELIKFSPFIFLTEKWDVMYPVNGDVDMPVFTKFMKRFSQESIDLITFFRCLMYSTITSTLRLKVDSITIIYGESGNGKSVFQTILRMLSNNLFVTTTPDVLLKCRFELANLQNKKLLIVSDLPSINVDELELLKKISTQDSLFGLKKGQNGNIPFVFYGNIVIATNSKLEIPKLQNHRMNALTRRIKNIYIPATTIDPRNRFDLITEEPNNKFSGPLFLEVGNIVKWALSTPPELVMNYFHNHEVLKLISQNFVENDSLHLFLENFVEFNYHSKLYLNKSSEDGIWGLYSYFCQVGRFHMLPNKQFNISVVEYYNNRTLPVSKDGRDKKGFFFSNIRLKFKKSRDDIDLFFEQRIEETDIKPISSIGKILFSSSDDALCRLFPKKKFNNEEINLLKEKSTFIIEKDEYTYLDDDETSVTNVIKSKSNVINNIFENNETSVTNVIKSKSNVINNISDIRKSYLLHPKKMDLLKKSILYEEGATSTVSSILEKIGLKINQSNTYKIIDIISNQDNKIYVEKMKDRKLLPLSVIHNVRIIDNE